jgi:hypothetical protein
MSHGKACHSYNIYIQLTYTVISACYELLNSTFKDILFEIQSRLTTIKTSISLPPSSISRSVGHLRLPPYDPALPPAPSKSREKCWIHADYVKAKGSNATSPVYMEDSEGNVLGQAFNQALSTFIRARWMTLERCGGLPDSWDQADSKTLNFVYIPTCSTFPAVRLCKLNWKLRQWCINKFPSWRRGWLAKLVPAPAPSRLKSVGPRVPIKRLRSASTIAAHEAEHPNKITSKLYLCIMAYPD